MPHQNVKCPACGAENPPDYTFCFHCRAVGDEALPKAVKKSAAKKSAAKKTTKRKR